MPARRPARKNSCFRALSLHAVEAPQERLSGARDGWAGMVRRTAPACPNVYAYASRLLNQLHAQTQSSASSCRRTKRAHLSVLRRHTHQIHCRAAASQRLQQQQQQGRPSLRHPLRLRTAAAPAQPAWLYNQLPTAVALRARSKAIRQPLPHAPTCSRSAMGRTPTAATAMRCAYRW